MFKPAAKLTMDNAAQILAAGLQAIASGESDFDLSDLLSVDSSAVAALLEWRRQALQKGARLRFGVLPANLQSLIALYGVADLLPASAETPKS
jgi:phospholipid transport system transporter-binding protein